MPLFFGFRQEIKMLGRSEFALRQGFAAQNACTAQKRRFFGSSGQRVEQGASEARKRPGGAFVARCACRGTAVPRASLVARSKKHHNEGCGAFSFTCHGRGRAAPMALHGAKGVFSFAKENTPFISPQRTAGAFRLRPCTPNDQKGGASPLLFGLSTPCF